MKKFKMWKKLLIMMVIGLVVFQNISTVFAAVIDVKESKPSLKIVKIDKDTKENISGSIFEIENVQTGEIKELSIKNNGIVVEDSMEEGEYRVKEKKAPEGYAIDENTYNIALKDKEELITSISTKNKSIRKTNLKATISDNIFTKVELQDGNGTKINQGDRVKNGGGVILNMNFSFTGKNYKAGDTFKTILPDDFNFGSTDLNGDFLPSTEAEWSFDAATRELTIKILKDGVQEGSYDVSITTVFRSFSETEQTSQKAIFATAGGDTIYEYEVIPLVDYASTVDLKLHPSKINPEKAFVTAKLNLTKETNSVGELRLADFTYDGDTKIDKSTVKVYASDVSARGAFIGSKQLLEEGKDYTVEHTDSELIIKLTNGLDGKGYEVTYTRVINTTKESLVSLVSRAQTVGDSKILSVGLATVEARIVKFKHLEKKAIYNAKTQTIDWAINVNYDQAELTPNTVLTDVLTDNGINYVDNSLKIREVTFSPTTGQAIVGDIDASSNWTTPSVATNGSFETTYKNTDKKAYQITYATKVTDFSPRDIINEVTDEKGVKATEKLSFEPSLVKKESGTVDYFNNLMSWTITANTERIKMSDMIIIDEFSTGVKSLDNLDVYAYTTETDKVKLVKDVDYTITDTATPAGFKIQLIGNYATTDKEIEVKLVTKIDLSNGAQTLDNKAYISYYDGYITHYSDTKKASLEVDSKISQNGAKYGTWNYETGTIDWIVSLNAMNLDFENLIFDDEMVEGTSYVEGSLEFRRVGGPNELVNLNVPLASTGNLVKEGDKNYPTKIETTDKKIHLEFGDIGKSQVFVKYKTTPDNKWYFSESVKNVAIVSDDGKNQKEYEAEAFIFESYSPISKTGQIDMSYNNKINWKLKLTDITDKRIVTNPTITDIVDGGITGAKIVKNSFKVIDTKTGELIDSKYYDITFTDNGFTVQFKNYTATSPIEVTYDTISLISGPVKNTVSVDAKDYGNLSVQSRTATNTVSPNFTMGSGSGIDTMGSIEITKVDKADPTKKLEGAKFQLYTLDGKKSGQEATTDSEGKIIFDSIQAGKYKLVETEAPTGYTISEELKNGKEVTVTSDGLTSEYTVENPQKTGSVILTKVDNFTKAALAGAEFELQKNDGTKIKEGLETNATGELTVGDLEPGNYQFIEKKAPTGYQLDEAPLEFTIEFNQPEPATVTKENKAKAGTVILTKKDSVTKEGLASAVFQLQKADGTNLQNGLETNESGNLEVRDLEPGDYKLIETAAPTGYILDASPVAFTISFNQTEAVSVTKENTAKTGSVILTKQDSVMKTGLAGAEFKLQTATGTTLQNNLATDLDGELEIADLAPGDYQLVETAAPIGYTLSDTPVNFTIDFNQATPVTVTKENTAKTGMVVLTKQDSVLKTGLAGAKFELQKADGTKLKDALITNASGKLEIADLAPGNYQLVEKEAPIGYQLDATPLAFTIEFNQAEKLNITKENTLKKGSVTLTKRASGTNDLLANATFKLQKADGTILKENLKTDTNGQLEIVDLTPGNYQLIETAAPTGYKLDTDPVSFTIEFNQTEMITVSKENTAKTGTVELNKKASGTSKQLQGAEFKLEDDAGKVLKEKLATDASGKLEIKDLAPGDYRLIETKAPTGYQLDATPTPFTIIFNQAEKVSVTKENTAKTGGVILTKKDDKTNATLSGATFELQTTAGAKLQENLVTNAEGQVEITNLAPGNYQFVETSAPTGYELDTTPVPFTITFNQSENVNVTKTNKAKSGSVVLTKQDNVTKAGLAGAEFELQDSTGAKLRENLITNTTGKLELTNLAPGDYQLAEIAAPTGYVLDATPVTFTVEFNQTELLNLTKENTAKTGSVILTKQDSLTKQTLADAEFELQNEAGTKLQENLVTNADGEIEIVNLAPGNYQLVETKAPTGYQLDKAPVRFTIVFNQTEKLAISKENIAKTGSVILTKVDGSSKEKLAGAEFELRNATGTKVGGNFVTDADGKLVIADLAPGEYSLVETKAPTGYQLDNTPILFAIEFNQVKPITVTKENRAKTGDVILTKVDAKTNKGLAGAKFELQTKQGQILKTGLTTGTNGELKVTNLEPGEYCFVETEAPMNYELDRTKIEFTIVFNQISPVPVTKTNKLKVGLVKVAHTDTEGNHLVNPENYTGDIGEKYETESKEFAGYQLVGNPINKVGTFAEGTQKVTFIYEKIKDPIMVNQAKPINATSPIAAIEKPATVMKKAKRLPSTGDKAPFKNVVSGLFISAIGIFVLRRVNK
ncbi:SpaA isopeptide-forming pilin-related protein [Listeria monocytogenes]|uniref:SpaA isopeptide-forming pilin-related protein n=3 Tax=Listeria monocytogenes TaxID=1639 RepID=UPI00098DF59C|nr:SpaA isopeptide-forming pilin-related protein [Listeria monocytogenes]EAD7601316.1 cell wall anchor protein [Listeria monocytogenes]HAA0614138.1 cell wall anchor protein [Listeria monocytogenes]